MTPKWLLGFLTQYAARLRFPQLFLVTCGLFVLDVIIPDFIPFADEVLLAMATLLLGSWQKERAASEVRRERKDAESPAAGN